MLLSLTSRHVGASIAATLALACPLTQAYAQAPATPIPPTANPPAAASSDSAVTQQRWNLHAQNTDIVQGDASFPAKYSGPNSLSDQSQIQHTVTADVFAGLLLGPGTELHADFLAWQGFGLGGTLGVEAFPDGDGYKLGTINPNYTFAHLFVRRTYGLGGPQEDVPDGPLTLAGKQDISRVTLTAGRFTPADMFDTNAYANDPHTQFLNWAFINNLAWDYAADSVGYTTGIAAEWNQPKWTLRYGFFQLPSIPNSFTADDQLLMWPARGADGPFFKSWEMNTEWERRYSIKSHPGKIRLLAWLNEADMAKYDAETALLDADGPGANIATLRSYRFKYGFGLNWEQEVADNVGVFSRLGWNDGLEEAWAYTDASWSASVGTSVNGALWHRPGDTVGLAGVTSGTSSESQQFLEAGGAGILDGDGALNYGWESVVESYYDWNVWKTSHLAADYQFVSNPAFNRDRGPISIYGIRFHWEI